MAKRKTLKEFIEKANKLHNNYYNYDKTVYVKAMEKVLISCPLHGEFNQLPSKHLSGQGCPKCRSTKISKSKTTSFENFQARAYKIHNNKYIYDKDSFTSLKDKLKITCPVHGSFLQEGYSHLKGSGCNKCAIEYRASGNVKPIQDFLLEAKQLHHDKYNYSKVNYTKITDKVTIICPHHGEFTQQASIHLQGNGCRKCGYESTGWNKSSWANCANSKDFTGFKLYVVQCYTENEVFIKIGITARKLKHRLASIPYKYTVIEVVENTSDYIFDLEKQLHRTLKKHKHKPEVKFPGSCECFNYNKFKEIYKHANNNITNLLGGG